MSTRSDGADPGEIQFSPGLTDPARTWVWDSLSDDEHQWFEEAEIDLSDLRPVHVTTYTRTHPLTGAPTTHRLYTNRPITHTPEEADMYNPARDTDDDRYANEEFQAATAVLERFVTSTGIYQEIGLEGLMRDAAQIRPALDLDDDVDRGVALKRVQHVLKERCVNNDLRIAKVWLDTADEYGGRSEKSMYLTDCPRIVFTTLTAADRSLRAATGDRRWIAVYFDPGSAETIEREDSWNPGTYNSYPNEFDGAGYIAIVGAYDGLPAAEEAAAELAQAVRTIAHYRSGTALEHDPVSDTLVEDRGYMPSAL